MPTIKDGNSGNVAGVTSRNELKAYASVEEEFKRISEEDGEAYIWAMEKYDYTAADTIALIRSSHQTKKLHIWKMLLHGDTETEVEIHCPTATFTIAGTEVVGTCLNRAKNNEAQAECYADETGNTQGTVVERVLLKADTDYTVDFKGALILGNGQSVGVDFVTVGAEALVTIWGYFK